jgi:hypothetical protein
MAMRHYGWAWAQPVDGSAKLVLLYLVERADRAGECWPGVATIAEATGLDYRTVRRALAGLDVSGLITRRRRHRSDGTRTSDHITLRLEVKLTARTDAKLQRLEGNIAGPRGHIVRADPPSDSPSDSPNGRANKYPQHEHEPNARQWAQRLITERRLPLDENELLTEAYRLGNGNPYHGMRVINQETERELDTAHDPAAAVRARLKHAAVYA